MTGENEIKKVVEEVMRKDRISISRIPTETKNEFIEFAKENYCDDYGMCFKAVWEYFKQDARYTLIIEKLCDLTLRLDQLEGKGSTKVIKTIDGKRKEVVK